MLVEKNQLEDKLYQLELAQYKTSASKLDALTLERLLHKVEDMEQRHSQELADLSQAQSQLVLAKDSEILQLTATTNKETNRLKGLLKNKNEELERMKN